MTFCKHAAPFFLGMVLVACPPDEDDSPSPASSPIPNPEPSRPLLVQNRYMAMGQGATETPTDGPSVREFIAVLERAVARLHSRMSQLE